MNQQIEILKPKVFKCFTCGVEIIFKSGQKERNKYGKLVPKRFNLDGTAHICEESKKEEYHQSDEYNNRKNDWTNRQRRWWHAYGKKRYRYGYKNEYNKYNRKTYDDSWRENYRKREEYKQQYSNQSLSVHEALTRLNLKYEDLEKLTKLERFRAIKTAYRILVLKVHPDRYPKANEQEKQSYTAKFRDITEAYELLESKYENLGAGQ